MSRTMIYEQIDAEREYQDRKFGPVFDTGNRPNDWVAFIAAYAGRAFASDRETYTPSYRSLMVKVAALAVAAIEAYDGK